MINLDLQWDFLVDNDIATEEEIRLVAGINGYNEKSINDIIYVRTGYHDIEQLWDCARKYFYFSDALKEDLGLEE